MRVVDCEQGTPEWIAARCGRVTASNLADVLSRAAGGKGEGATRRTYKARIAGEIKNGYASKTGGVKTKPMESGTLNEPFARAAYEARQGVMVDQVGFVIHPRIERFGASPDGLVVTKVDGVDAPVGVIEIKCGNDTTHINWMLAGIPPAEHQLQMMAEMSCTGLPWCDFVSYYPDMLAAKLQLFVVRLHRDEKLITKMEAEVRIFLEEVDEMVEQLTLLEMEDEQR